MKQSKPPDGVLQRLGSGFKKRPVAAVNGRGDNRIDRRVNAWCQRLSDGYKYDGYRYFELPVLSVFR